MCRSSSPSTRRIRRKSNRNDEHGPVEKRFDVKLRTNLLQSRGVVTSVASNNILNPFTPYGDASLNRMANLYANVGQLARDEDLRNAFAMVTSGAAELIGAPYGLREGGAADIVLIDAPDPASAVREIAPVIAGWKHGVKTFSRPRPMLLRPGR